jgi:hypothetical protein
MFSWTLFTSGSLAPSDLHLSAAALHVKPPSIMNPHAQVPSVFRTVLVLHCATKKKEIKLEFQQNEATTKHHSFSSFLCSSHKIKLLQISAIEIENTLKLQSLQSRQLINKKTFQ